MKESEIMIQTKHKRISFSLLGDRMFYAVIFQTGLFLTDEQCIEISEYLPAGRINRKILQKALFDMIDLKNQYCCLLINSTGLSRDGLTKRFPIGVARFLNWKMGGDKGSIIRLMTDLSVINELAVGIPLVRGLDKELYHNKRRELFQQITSIHMNIYAPLLSGMDASRRKGKKQRIIEGIDYLIQ